MSSPRALVIGGSGQLGTAVLEAARTFGFNTLSVGRSTGLDVRSQCLCEGVIEDTSPVIVVNCAAEHDLKECEQHPDKAFAVNAFGALNVAKACRKVRARHVFVSTDYVFSGDGDHRVDSDPTPCSVYGLSKLTGEYFCQQEYPTIVARTSYLFGGAGARMKGNRNIILDISGKVKAGEPLEYFEDVFVAPTFTRHVATMIFSLASPGVYHLCSSGYCSLAELALTVARQMGGERPRVCKRYHKKEAPFSPGRPTGPLVSSFDDAPRWELGVAQYLNELGLYKESQ